MSIDTLLYTCNYAYVCIYACMNTHISDALLCKAQEEWKTPSVEYCFKEVMRVSRQAEFLRPLGVKGCL